MTSAFPAGSALPPLEDTDMVAARLHDGLARDAARVVLTLTAADGSDREVTGGALAARAGEFAARFEALGCRGHVVGVCLYHGLDLYAAFIGALWAGCIPTMVPPPSPRMEPEKYARSFRHVVHYVLPRAMVLDAAAHERLVAAGHLEAIAVELIIPDSVSGGAVPAIARSAPEDVILIQHSSGTTGLQKGIALSNRAVLQHNSAYAASLGMTRDDVIVSWLPLYHDMGFIACFLLPLLERIPIVAMSPFDWVRTPGLLLEKITEHRGTLCWLPNFAFALLARSVRPARLKGALDLSSVRAWVNSSEPVLDSSMRAFAHAFGALGVHPHQLTASYAMAENVYAVTQSLPGEYRTLRVHAGIYRDAHRAERAGNDAASLDFVSNGRAVSGTEVIVLDDRDEGVADGAVGQIALRGGYRFSGYHGRDDLTAASMTADGWYRTGDLGFLHDGELYVTGRKKDLIIIQGRNFYPGDLEASAGTLDGVAPGRVVAFGIQDSASGTEQLILLAESTNATAADATLPLRIRAHIAQEFDCTPSVVRIVPPRWLVKSSSGKLARSENREKYLAQLAEQRDV
ncbi:MAG: AMP-binding protein [Gemmatimonadota bacterium]|nr:AMP-binding protein [Gemmatimonadota bacterium]